MRTMIGDVPKSVFGMSIDDVLGEWREMYWKIFKIDPCLDRIMMPEEKLGFGWAIPRVSEIPINLLWEACKERWATYSYAGDNLEEAVPTNERHYLKGPYGIWVRDRREADEELKNTSADQIAKKGFATITLDERLALGLFFASRVSLGLHLDVENVTWCTGSRYSDGRVPRVSWRPGARRLCVDACRPGRSGAGLRARAVVS